ncbi:MAG: MerR family transcriptional regulator [Thermomicrobiales bacterium]|jgi:hypothetical protein
MTGMPRTAAVFDDQNGAADKGLRSEVAEGIVPAATDRPPLARFYMTSDLRAATGLPRTHLDYYLRAGLILPTARTESGYLLFDETELETLRSIIAERQSGLSIREIRRRRGR